MMMQEFTALTGFYPSNDFYRFIEEIYYDFDGTKQEFCKAYKQNKDGLAERIRQAYNLTTSKTRNMLEAQQRKEREALEAKVKQLEAALEREQEWKPYEDRHNVSQVDYSKLESSDSTRELSDEEAIDIIANEFGFDRSKIRIVHEVHRLEINRHSQVRRVGTIERKALFNAWDWNYICFNVRGNTTMGYEMHNGELRMYWG